MRRTERYFGFGLLLAGVGLPFLVEKLSGSTTAAIWTCIVCLLGAIVLIYLSFQKGQDAPEDDSSLFGRGAIPAPESQERDPARLEITWHAGEKPYVHEYRMPNDPSQTLHTHFRIVVINLSKGEQAKDVEVILEDISPRTLDCVPCHLRMMNNILPGDAPIEKFSLNPQGKQPIDVMMWRPDSSRFQIWHTVLRQPTDIPAQTYTIKITASAANASPTSETFEIFRDGAAWNMRLFEKQDSPTQLAPNLLVHGFEMALLSNNNGVWSRTNANRMAWVLFIRNKPLENKDVGDGIVRAELLYYPEKGRCIPIAPMAWLGQQDSTMRLKSGETKDLLVAVEIIPNFHWSFLVNGETCSYGDLWVIGGNCEFEIRFIDDSTGRPMKPSFCFKWEWRADSRPSIYMINGITLQ
jgi:hypothetical protein